MKHQEENGGAVNRVSILYLLYTINMPMSNSQLIDFASETNVMDFFSLRVCLVDMRDCGLLKEEFEADNQIYYSITDEGITTMRTLKKQFITDDRANIIHSYIFRHKKKIKADAEVDASYFIDPNSGYIVKCGIYEGDSSVVMELNMSVSDRNLAEHICRKWKAESDKFYKKFIDELTSDFSGNDLKKAE